MNAPIALKYVRTVKGFVVFPCLAASAEQISAAVTWPKVSHGIVVWDFNGLPLCLSPGIHTLHVDDTNVLRGEWGLPAYQIEPVCQPSLQAVAEFCERMPKLATESVEVI